MTTKEKIDNYFNDISDKDISMMKKLEAKILARRKYRVKKEIEKMRSEKR